MAKHLLYILLLITAAIACEKVYIADLDNVEDLLVVEAILISDKEINDVYIYKTLNFNSESNGYPAVTGATVSLVDDLGNIKRLPEQEKGKYRLTGLIDTRRSYYLSIEIGNDVYKSEIQTVPEIPDIDSLYAGPDYITSTSGVANSEEDIITTAGLQVFADMNYTGNLNYYRFAGHKIIQFIDYYDTVVDGEPVSLPIYGWDTYSLSGNFNVAGPPKYSAEKDIKKHRLEFFSKNYYEVIADTQYFAGWIYFIDQYGISEQAYNYYSDLNSQLEAQGKIFDPVYVQVSGNITCTSNPEEVVLGNFEIESHKEHRCLLKYYINSEYFTLKTITRFDTIPTEGYIKDTQPEFWQY